MLQFLDNIRARITNAGYGSQNRTISLISSWLANTLWLIESRFLNLAKETYSQNEVVYACLRLLSQSVPEAPLVPYADSEKKKALDAAHPLTLLIRRPNELMTEYEFWELTTLHMAIVGRSTWWKERNNAGQVIGLWPLRPDRVGPRYSDSDKEGERVLWGYNYQVPGTGVIVPIPRRDVIAFNFPDPAGESGGIVEGIGPVMALARQVASDNEATKFVGALLANYAAPTVVIKTKAKAKDEEEANLIKSHFRSQFGGANRGVPALADGEAEIQVIGFNLRELEFPEIREIAESRIAAALGVPAVLAGLRVGLMRSTFNNMTESRRFFSETTLSNYWRRYQDQYTLDIAAEFDENIVCEFDTSKVKALAGALLELAQPVVDAFKAGVAMVNEYRIALKQEPLDPEYGEVLYVPNTVTVVPVTDKAKAAIEQRQAALPKPPEVPLLEGPKENEEGETGESKEEIAKKAVKHLQGKHDQSSHAHGGGNYGSMAGDLNGAKPRNADEASEFREQFASDHGDEGHALVGALDDWSGGGGEAAIRQEARDYYATGNANSNGAILAQAVGAAPSNAPVLHRGITLSDMPQASLKRFETGKEIDVDLSSFSADATIAHGFAYGGDGPTAVMFRVSKGAHAVNIQPLVDNHMRFKEAEWISAGRFRVTKAELVDEWPPRAKKRLVVHLTQVGLFGAGE